MHTTFCVSTLRSSSTDCKGISGSKKLILVNNRMGSAHSSLPNFKMDDSVFDMDYSSSNTNLIGKSLCFFNVFSSLDNEVYKYEVYSYNVSLTCIIMLIKAENKTPKLSVKQIEKKAATQLVQAIFHNYHCYF